MIRLITYFLLICFVHEINFIIRMICCIEVLYTQAYLTRVTTFSRIFSNNIEASLPASLIPGGRLFYSSPDKLLFQSIASSTALCVSRGDSRLCPLLYLRYNRVYDRDKWELMHDSVRHDDDDARMNASDFIYGAFHAKSPGWNPHFFTL